MEHISKEQLLLDPELRAWRPGEVDTEQVKALSLFADNTALAHWVANKYRRQCYNNAGFDFEDIQQEAYKGLWEACLRYEDDRGSTFSSFATSYIVGHILTFLGHSDPIHLPRQYRDIRYALGKYNLTLPLTAAEIALLVDAGVCTQKQIEAYIDVSVLSLDCELESGISLSDVIPAPEVFTDMSDEEIDKIVDAILRLLKPRKLEIVEEWLYSVIAGEPLKQAELAAKYKVSRAYICRLEGYVIKAARLKREEILRLCGLK